MPQSIAILASDIHLSHKPPIFRSEEPDWYATQKRYLDELAGLASERVVPIVYAGDIFDKWNSPAELINFAIDNLPPGCAIPGQHDLPNHRYEDIQKSAYWTLHKAEVIDDLGRTFVRNNQLALFPFPWGKTVQPASDTFDIYEGVMLAIVHSYIWQDEKTCYPGAVLSQHVKGYDLTGYDAAVFGDNHKGFIARYNDCNIMNCGTFMIRKSDERAYRPMVGILYEDGSIKPYYLDTSKDVYCESEIVEKVEKVQQHFDHFIQDLRTLGMDALDFRQAIKHRLDNENVSLQVRQAVLEAIDGD